MRIEGWWPRRGREGKCFWRNDCENRKVKREMLPRRGCGREVGTHESGRSSEPENTILKTGNILDYKLAKAATLRWLQKTLQYRKSGIRVSANLPGELKTSGSRLAPCTLESCFSWPPVNLPGLVILPPTTNIDPFQKCPVSPQCASWRCQGCFWRHRSSCQRCRPRSWWWWGCASPPIGPGRSPTSGRAAPGSNSCQPIPEKRGANLSIGKVPL